MPSTLGLFWDVDGTMAETEGDGHRRAFNAAFAERGLPWRWAMADYGELLRISGGEERLRHWLAMAPPGAPGDQAGQWAMAAELQERKQVHYGRIVAAGGLAPRPGVVRLIQDAAAAGWRQWIVTTSRRRAVEALLSTQPFQPLGSAFCGWICGEDVTRKKPDPQAYAMALGQSGLPPRQVVALEDSPHGAEAARRAGLRCLVTPSRLTGRGRLTGAAAVVDHLGDGPQQPATVLTGPALGCQPHVDLAYLEGLLHPQGALPPSAPPRPDPELTTHPSSECFRRCGSLASGPAGDPMAAQGGLDSRPHRRLFPRPTGDSPVDEASPAW
ncbi:MAG: HAD-IA family hydrolase [Cyanobacteria bacterium MAG CAR4_bin_6]|nr:HAD-IA family hydrolase [Cyanobacteria bacterium MAG CAR4_bin_6]